MESKDFIVENVVYKYKASMEIKKSRSPGKLKEGEVESADITCKSCGNKFHNLKNCLGGIFLTCNKCRKKELFQT
jgi:hypothetical protein